MADRGAERRPPGSIDVEVGPPGAGVEVPLVGTEVPDAGPPDEAPPTNWRRAIGIALVAGTVIGVGASVIRSVSDDDSTSTTTLPGDDLATVITTPPTLAPLETLPPPDLRSDPAAAAPSAVTIPSYAEIRDVGLAELRQYDIGAAVELLGRDVARRSETHVELGNGGFAIDVTIERDPVRDRYQIVLESRGDTQVAIVDVPTGTTYVNPGTDNRQDVPNADIIAGSTAADVNEYFDRLLLGPLRPDTYQVSSISGGDVVSIDGADRARRFLTTIAGEAIPEWQLYAFSPVFEFPVEDRPDALDYAVYVTADGRIARVDGVSLVGDVPQLVLHRLVEVDEPIVIDAPPPATTAPVPTTSTADAATTIASTAPGDRP